MPATLKCSPRNTARRAARRTVGAKPAHKTRRKAATPAENTREPQTVKIIDDLQDGELLIPVRQLAREILGRDLNPACQWRWIIRGYAGNRLAVLNAGGRWCSTRRHFLEFCARRTEQHLSARGTRGIEDATDAELSDAGLI
jgi:hypothetical protein